MLDRITVYPFLYLCQAKNLNLCIGICRVSPPTRNVIYKAIVSARLSSVTLILVPLIQSQLHLPFLWPMGTGRRASCRFVPQGGNRVPVSRAEVLFPLATHGWAESCTSVSRGGFSSAQRSWSRRRFCPLYTAFRRDIASEMPSLNNPSLTAKTVNVHVMRAKPIRELAVFHRYMTRRFE